MALRQISSELAISSRLGHGVVFFVLFFVEACRRLFEGRFGHTHSFSSGSGADFLRAGPFFARKDNEKSVSLYLTLLNYLDERSNGLRFYECF